MKGSARLQSVARDDIRVVFLRHAGQQPADVLDLELAVAIAERDEVEARGTQAAAHGCAVALVDPVVNDPELRVRGGEPVGDLGSRVGAAVVDGDDLEFVGKLRQRRQRFSNERLDVVGLVVRRKEERQRRDVRR